MEEIHFSKSSFFCTGAAARGGSSAIRQVPTGEVQSLGLMMVWIGGGGHQIESTALHIMTPHPFLLTLASYSTERLRTV